MSDERLRLVAEVQDGFTRPLAKLETALRWAGATGTQDVKTWTTLFRLRGY